MVSVGVSALGRTNLHFVDRGVKVNGQYYRDILLRRDLLPDIKQYSDYFTFQHNGAPAHRAHETVELLRVETPDIIPPNYILHFVTAIILRYTKNIYKIRNSKPQIS